MSAKTKQQVANDVLSKAAELEGNLLRARAVAGDYAEDVEAILERVREMNVSIRNALRRGSDNPPG